MKILRNIFFFYYDGFKGMDVGKKLWLIILIKIFILFAVLKVFFFPDRLNEQFQTDRERSDYVIEQLSNDI